jgi:hypothetical protein
MNGRLREMGKRKGGRDAPGHAKISIGGAQC